MGSADEAPMKRRFIVAARLKMTVPRAGVEPEPAPSSRLNQRQTDYGAVDGAFNRNVSVSVLDMRSVLRWKYGEFQFSSTTAG